MCSSKGVLHQFSNALSESLGTDLKKQKQRCDQKIVSYDLVSEVKLQKYNAAQQRLSLGLP